MKRHLPKIIVILLGYTLIPVFGHADCPEYTFINIADTATSVPGGNGGFLKAFLSPIRLCLDHTLLSAVKGVM